MTGVDKAVLVRTVAAVMLSLSWVTVILRVYVRAWLVRAFGPDDWFAVATLSTLTLHCIFVFIGLSYRIGGGGAALRHNMIEALKWWWAASLPYIVSTVLIKWTVGIFLLRFCRIKAHKWTIYAVLSIVTVYNIAYLIICVFQCLPVGHFWLQYAGQEGSCIPRKILTNLSYAAAAMNAAGDLVLGGLPILIVRQLQMNKRTKISVAGVLALGSISCFSTIIRLPYLVSLLNDSNFLSATTPVAVWGLIELGIGLTAASSISLKPLITLIFKGQQPYNRSRGYSYPKRDNSGMELKDISSGHSRKKERTDSEIELALDIPDPAHRR